MVCTQKHKVDEENNVEPKITANKAKAVLRIVKKVYVLLQKSAQTNKLSILV